jgi:3'-5' exoribonuclease 1
MSVDNNNNAVSGRGAIDTSTDTKDNNVVPTSIVNPDHITTYRKLPSKTTSQSTTHSGSSAAASHSTHTLQTTTTSSSSSAAAAAATTTKQSSRHSHSHHLRATCEADYCLVVDYEATCKKGDRCFPNEIIEFPIVVIDTYTLCVVAEFRRYVKPSTNPILTDFCTELTGITQDQVDRADTLDVVLKEVDEWLVANHLRFVHHDSDSASDAEEAAAGMIDAKNDDNGDHEWRTFAFATDGPWDFGSFLLPETVEKRIPVPDCYRLSIDIRQAFSDRNLGGQRRCNIKRMLKHYGLKFQGNPHSGLDDSRNIARIACKLMSAHSEKKLKCNHDLRERFPRREYIL